MAKRLIEFSMPPTPGRSNEVRLLPGERLTGRWISDNLTASAYCQVEVWDKGHLILKSQAIPTGRQNPYTANGLIGAYLFEGVFGDNVTAQGYKDWDDKSDIERIVSIWTQGFGSTIILLLEIESPD